MGGADEVSAGAIEIDRRHSGKSSRVSIGAVAALFAFLVATCAFSPPNVGPTSPATDRTLVPGPSGSAGLAPGQPAASLTESQIEAAIGDAVPHWQCPGHDLICIKVNGGADALKVVLFGDSSIGSLDVGMTEWARAHGVTYVLAASGGCTVSGNPQSSSSTSLVNGPNDAKCESRYQAAVDAVASLTGRILVLGTANSEDRPIVLPDGSIAPGGSEAHRAAVEQGLDNLVNRLSRPGVTVVLVGPAGHTLKPWCLAPGPGLCSLPHLAADWAAQQAIGQEYAEVAARHKGSALFVRLDDLVCPGGGPCTSWQGNTLLRWDGIHFTRPGSRLMVAQLVDRIRALGVQLP